MTTRKVAALALVAIAALTLSACSSPDQGSSANQSSATASNDVPIRYVQESPSFAFLPFYVATAEGYFKKQKLDINRLPDSTSDAQLIAQGQADIADGAPAFFINGLAANQPIKLLGVVLAKPALQLVLSPKTVSALAVKGVTPKSSIKDRIKALKGLTLTTYPEGSAVTQLLHVMLDNAGLSKSVTVVNQTDTTAILTALRTNQSDGFAFSPPVTSQAVAGGFGKVWLAFNEVPSFGNYYNNVAVTNDSFAKAHPDEVVRYLKALNSAFAALKNHPAKVSADVKKMYFPQLDQKTYDLAFNYVRQVFIEQSSMKPTKDAWNASVQLTEKTTGKDLSMVTLKSSFDLSFLSKADN